VDPVDPVDPEEAAEAVDAAEAVGSAQLAQVDRRAAGGDRPGSHCNGQHPIRPTGVRTTGLAQSTKVATDSA
jgi:hypothetical protein